MSSRHEHDKRWTLIGGEVGGLGIGEECEVMPVAEHERLREVAQAVVDTYSDYPDADPENTTIGDLRAALEEREQSLMSEQQPFEFGEGPKPQVFIQWKGTNVCLDFTCECGHHGHFDGYFAYVLRCTYCGKTWEMPFHLYPRETNDDEFARDLERDE